MMPTYTTYSFSYIGGPQTWIVPNSGEYQIDCYGAQGGDSYTSPYYAGGLGGYVSIKVTLTAGTTFYMYVGGRPVANNLNGGYNGGGSAADLGGSIHGAPGGGATDIRQAFGDLNSRIIVAGGAGGGAWDGGIVSGMRGGNGGGNIAADGGANPNSGTSYGGGGGSQTFGGISGFLSGYPLGTAGSFGYGGSGSYGGGGAGAGYFGGGGGTWYVALFTLTCFLLHRFVSWFIALPF
jgi:hypothetical protein